MNQVPDRQLSDIDKLAFSLAGESRPHNASIVLAYAKARNVEGLRAFLNLIVKDHQ